MRKQLYQQSEEWHLYVLIIYGKARFSRNLSAKQGLKDLSLNQLKINLSKTYGKDERITTNFEASNDEKVVDKVYLQTFLSIVKGHLSFMKIIMTNHKFPSDLPI